MEFLHSRLVWSLALLVAFGITDIHAEELPVPTKSWSDGRTPEIINNNKSTQPDTPASVRTSTGAIVKSGDRLQTKAGTGQTALGGDEYSEYGRSLKNRKTIASLGPDVFGDQVDLYSGGLSFATTDISLPGNNALPVEIRRQFRVRDVKKVNIDDAPMGEWELDIPNLNLVMRVQTDPATGAAVNRFQWAAYENIQNCSSTNWESVVGPSLTNWYYIPSGVPGVNLRVDHQTRPTHYWNGRNANMPYGGEILWPNESRTKPSQGSGYLWTTKEGTYFSCLPNLKNTTGEGYLAITPDGTKYWYDWAASSHEPNLELGPSQPLYRRKRSLYVTRVEDRFGNYVEYTYSNTFNSPVKLDKIQASDGRLLISTQN